jgi:nucleotide-binding universal stress UspA family protein
VPNIAAFRSALRDIGYVDGRNMTLVPRYGDGVPDRLAALARELVALKPDVIVAGAHSSSLLKNLEFEPSPHLLRTCFGYGFDFRRAA